MRWTLSATALEMRVCKGRRVWRRRWWVGEEETFISIRLGCCRCSGPEYIYKYMYTHGMSKNTHTNFRGPLTLVSVLTKPTQVLIRFVIHTRIHTQEREREREEPSVVLSSCHPRIQRQPSAIALL
jgi:hypothetical protein